jgi:putative exporter of polyketide antibiotics
MELSKPFRLRILAISEWLMVLPATMFLAVAALRLLQPRQYQPARTSWLIFEWTTTHISRLGAAMLFLGMPGLVVVAGCVTLLRMWREDQSLRHDAVLGLTVVRRHVALAFLAVATLLGAAILTLAVVHVAVD